MIEVIRHQLSNGLRVVVHPDETTPLAAVNILYDVGSRDEDPDKTGFAHLFEHLMFGGSKHIPDFDEALQKVGGESNAWTNNDFTNYYITLPAKNLETAFWLESDRMLELNFTDNTLEVQRQVVIEEFKQRYLNQPYGDLPLLSRPLAFQYHPYQWPTIGKDIKHIEEAVLSDVEDFFYRFYSPDNAVLVVSGNVCPNNVFSLAEKWFGDIEIRKRNNRKLPEEPPQLEARFLKVSRDVPSSLFYISFHTGSRLHKDYYTTDFLSYLLSNGLSSRLIQSLIKELQYFSDINAFLSGNMDPGLFTIAGRLMPGVTMETAEAAVWEQLRLLTEKELSEYELQKVKNKIESNLRYSEISFLNKAMNLAFFEMLGDAAMINRVFDNYRSINQKDILTVASEIFRKENSSTIYYFSEKNE